MSPRFDTSDNDAREEGITAAAGAIGKGELVVMPTDTVYGIGADAFDAAAVGRLLQAKGRGRDMPPPVLVSSVTTMDALAVDIPDWARDLTDEFWPGPLTLVLFQQTSLDWDLGETRGTVAIRMPDHHIALELLQRTGPLAVSSANTTGRPAALDADQAMEMLGTEVTAVLDAGPVAGELASTILDCTDGRPKVLREGALPWSEVLTYLGAKGYQFGEADEGRAAPGEQTPVEMAPAAEKPAAKKSAAKKSANKKSAAKKSAAQKSAARKSATKKSAVKKSAVKAPAKKAAVPPPGDQPGA